MVNYFNGLILTLLWTFEVAIYRPRTQDQYSQSLDHMKYYYIEISRDDSLTANNPVLEMKRIHLGIGEVMPKVSLGRHKWYCESATDTDLIRII